MRWRILVCEGLRFFKPNGFDPVAP